MTKLKMVVKGMGQFYLIPAFDPVSGCQLHVPALSILKNTFHVDALRRRNNNTVVYADTSILTYSRWFEHNSI